MHYEAIGQFIYQIIVVIGGVIAIALGGQVASLIIAITIASAWYLLYAIVLVIRKANLRPRFTWKKHYLPTMLKVAAPFALADAFFKLNGSVDSVMLKYLANPGDVSWHAIALKLTVTLTVIPGAFATAFFPAMSRAFAESHEKLKDIFQQMMRYILMLSIPLSFGTFILAHDIIHLFFEDFPAAAPALQIFAVSIVLLFINYPIGNTLNAANKQGINTLNMGIALAVNVALNFWLIPQSGYIGAAVAAVISTVVLVVLGFIHSYRIIRFDIKTLFIAAFKITIATMAMSVILVVLDSVVPFFILVLLGGLTYCVGLLLVKGITLSELRELYHSLFAKRFRH
jgi:putative peptidoglycan lipid II flippase